MPLVVLFKSIDMLWTWDQMMFIITTEHAGAVSVAPPAAGCLFRWPADAFLAEEGRSQRLMDRFIIPVSQSESQGWVGTTVVNCL